VRRRYGRAVGEPTTRLDERLVPESRADARFAISPIVGAGASSKLATIYRFKCLRAKPEFF
jgi:hypothetical protein